MSTHRRKISTKTMDISVYSFTAVAQRAEKLMTDGGSMLTMTLLWRGKGDAEL